MPGFTQTALHKMGWHSSDTAALYFDNCRVPVEHLVRHENQGFKANMLNFNRERIYREVKVNAIDEGAEEVMRDLAARQLGFHSGSMPS